MKIALLLGLLAYIVCSTSCPNVLPAPLGPDPGALIEVIVRGTVGIPLTNISSPQEATRYANHILKKHSSFYDPLVLEQSHYTDYALQFRRYLPEKEGPVDHLSLTDDSQFQITYLGPARRQLWVTPGSPYLHDAVVQDYVFRTVLISDYYSPCQSDPLLCSVGGVVTLSIAVPLFVTDFYQRMGQENPANSKACFIEANYPPRSYGSENAYALYHPACEADWTRPDDAEEWECLTCHCTKPYPDIGCKAALEKYTGRVDMELTFTRIPYSSAVANEWRFEPGGPPHVGANMIPIKKDMIPSYEVYEYFDEHSAEVHEECVARKGYRKIIKIHSNAYNNGKHYNYIGPVEFHTPVNGTISTFANRCTIINDPVHHHPHNIFYLNNTATDKHGNPAGSRAKIGFCAVGSKKYVNAEWAVLANNCTDCTLQCIPPGSGDAYQANIPCQDVDVTDNAVGKIVFKSKINAWDVMCEGVPSINDTTCEPIYEDTNLTATTLHSNETCYPVGRPVCYHHPNELDYFEDNEEEVKYEHRDCGLSYVTDPVSRYGVDRESGPFKNTEFTLYGAQLRACAVPNVTQVVLSCTIPNSHSTNDNSEIVRVCESSYRLQCGTACRWEDSIANKVIPPGPIHTLVSFTCPAARDNEEPGGYYSIYRANYFETLGKHKGGSVVCTVA